MRNERYNRLSVLVDGVINEIDFIIYELSSCSVLKLFEEVSVYDMNSIKYVIITYIYIFGENI